MGTISVTLPNWLHKQLRERAKREGVSINQLISSAAAEKLAALSTEEYLGARAKRGTRHKFEQALKSVPAIEPEPFDRLPENLSSRQSRVRKSA
jgi:hypothetical protein